MKILERCISRAEELHFILRMAKNYTNPKQTDWSDTRAELLIQDIKSAQQSVRLTAFGFGLAGFGLGLVVGMFW